MAINIKNRDFQMGEEFPKFKAAAVQAAPIYLNRDASLEKACALIEEAAANGAEFILFPEVFLPGNVYWAQNLPWKEQAKFNVELFKNSVTIPSPTTDKLCEMAKKHHIFIVMGIHERDNKALYNTLIYIDREGKIIGKHRKFKPTGPEKLVWSDGDGSTLKVIPTEFGRLGGLICGEHVAVLPGFALAGMAEQLHVASWVGSAVADPIIAELYSRFHAIAYNSFTIWSVSMIDQQVLDKLGGGDTLFIKRTSAGIVEPGTGRVISNRLPIDVEGIVYGDVDLEACIPNYFYQDATQFTCGKQFKLFFNDRENESFNIMDGSGDLSSALGTEMPVPFDPFASGGADQQDA